VVQNIIATANFGLYRLSLGVSPKEKATTPREKLDGHHQTRFEGHRHHLRWSRRTGDRQSRMASTCGPMHPSGCGM